METFKRKFNVELEFNAFSYYKWKKQLSKVLAIDKDYAKVWSYVVHRKDSVLEKMEPLSGKDHDKENEDRRKDRREFDNNCQAFIHGLHATLASDLRKKLEA